MASLIHPYRNLRGGRWLRGNLHTHSTLSDGDRHPQGVVDDYAGRGFDFLMFSDHDKWMSPVMLRQLDAKGLVLIPGNEISAKGPHLLHVDAPAHVPPHLDRQQILDEIDHLAEQTGHGFAVMNHPNWLQAFDHAPIAQLRQWQRYAGLEIYNGVIGRLDGSPYATNKWDMLLADGRRLWGYAHDDSHRATDVELGWNVVYARSRTRAAVVDALRRGRFYGSTGVVISGIRVQGRRIRVTTRNARRIIALRDVGKRIAQNNGQSLTVEFPEDAKYVRFECWGDGEQFAWSQPFFPAAA